jgi:hypothetical protein
MDKKYLSMPPILFIFLRRPTKLAVTSEQVEEAEFGEVVG